MRERNYHCTEYYCDYTTDLTGHTDEELDEKLRNDGGYMSKEYTICPKCHSNSLVYIK